MTYRYEYRKSARRRGDPQLMPFEEVQGRQGFISLYGYDNDTVDHIDVNKATYGLDRFKLYSDLLYIDVDDDAEQVEIAKNKLIALGYKFKMYMSGSPDSAHFHLETVPQYEYNLHKVHAMWVEEHIGFKTRTTNGADNIYKASGIIRIEGTWHKSYPGEYKREVFSFDGPILDLTNYSKKVKSAIPKMKFVEEFSEEKLVSLFNQMLFTQIGDGERNNTIYKMAKLSRDIGNSYEDTLDKLDTYNNYMVSPPLGHQEFTAKIRSAYRGG